MIPVQKSNPATNQQMVLLSLVVCGVLVLTEKQMEGVVNIILSAVKPENLPIIAEDAPETTSQTKPDIISGYAALSAFLGYSIPTCVRMSKEGRFDAAVLDFGGGARKKMWDRRKLLEIASRKK